jgi:hypothetical protein
MLQNKYYTPVEGKKGPEHPMMHILELACAAQRVNQAYIKEPTPVTDKDGTFVYTKSTNKTLMLLTLNATKWDGEQKDHPNLLKITAADKELAAEIKKYFRKLIFAAVEGSSEFLTQVNSILGSEKVSTSLFGFVACLPTVYKRDYAITAVKRKTAELVDGYLGAPGEILLDLDCEILECFKSKNYDAWNVCAIINNHMVSWLDKQELKLGPCVIIKARIKDHSKHWKHGNSTTRLFYVKAAQ